MIHEKERKMDDSDSSDNEVALSQDSLAALQSVLGGVGLEELLHSNQALMEEEDSSDDDDEDNDNEGGDGLRAGESHADYYKRLYPERYTSKEPIDHLGKSTEDDYESSEARGSCNTIENPVAVVSMDDDYVQSIIVTAFARYYPNWSVLTELPSKDDKSSITYHFHWGDYEYIDWFSPLFMSEQIFVSCYYNRKGLIRKGHLAHILENWHVKKGYDDDRKDVNTSGIKRFAPKSYVIQLPRSLLGDDSNNDNVEDDVDKKKDEHTKTTSPTNEPRLEFINGFQEALSNSGFLGFDNEETTAIDGKETWILKPSVTNQANGMCLVQSEEQIQEAIYKSDLVQRAGDFVLQQYLQPLLLRGQKFHLRVFMLVCGNITAYVDSNFLAIFSLEQYDGADITETRAHFTNIAHQEVLSMQDQHDCMRLFEETKQDMVDGGLVQTIEEASERISGIQQRVYDIAAETIEAVSSELTFTSKKNCFEIFGLDFMIDPFWNTWLLEANAEPDLSKAGSRLQPIIDSLIVNTLHLTVNADERFQSELSSTSSHVDQNDDEGSNNSSPSIPLEDTSFVKVFERKGRSF